MTIPGMPSFTSPLGSLSALDRYQINTDREKKWKAKGIRTDSMSMKTLASVGMFEAAKKHTGYSIRVGVDKNKYHCGKHEIPFESLAIFLQKGGPIGLGKYVPPRPFFEPVIKELRSEIKKSGVLYRMAGEYSYVLRYKREFISRYKTQMIKTYEALGNYAVRKVREYIQEKGDFYPLATYTIAHRYEERGDSRMAPNEKEYVNRMADEYGELMWFERRGDWQQELQIRPLVNTKQLLGAITYTLVVNKTSDLVDITCDNTLWAQKGMVHPFFFRQAHYILESNTKHEKIQGILTTPDPVSKRTNKTKTDAVKTKAYNAIYARTKYLQKKMDEEDVYRFKRSMVRYFSSGEYKTRFIPEYSKHKNFSRDGRKIVDELLHFLKEGIPLTIGTGHTQTSQELMKKLPAAERAKLRAEDANLKSRFTHSNFYTGSRESVKQRLKFMSLIPLSPSKTRSGSSAAKFQRMVDMYINNIKPHIQKELNFK